MPLTLSLNPEYVSFERGWTNFVNFYRLLADSWGVYDNSGDRPVLIESSL